MIYQHCAVCHLQFAAQRTSAKYCSEACKQKAKYRRDHQFPESDLDEMMDNGGSALYELEKFVKNEKIDDEQKLRVMKELESYQFMINKMIAQISVIEIEQQNTWYQCTSCGQKTFGKVEKCDFCHESDFKRIKAI